MHAAKASAVTLGLAWSLLFMAGSCYRVELDLDKLDGAASNGPWLGKACALDAECSDHRLHCLGPQQDFIKDGGAPAHGLCTRDCETDADCRSFDQSAVCGTLLEAPLVREVAKRKVPRVCLLGCELGNGASDKCHGRAELACRPFAPLDAAGCKIDEDCPSGSACFRDFCREPACGPRCNADSDCERGRSCDTLTGLCSEHSVEPVPVGRDCSEDVELCGRGICLALNPRSADAKDSMSICSRSCTLGSLCVAEGGVCSGVRLDASGVGDAGYCRTPCDCDTDCQPPLNRCLPWSRADEMERFGSRGRCELAFPGDVTLTCVEDP